MISPREVFFSLFLNASLQIALFAIIAKLFSRFVARVRPKYQYSFYLGVLALCLLLPLINTFWNSRPNSFAKLISQDVLTTSESLDGDFWLWRGHSDAPHQGALGRNVEDAALSLWGVMLLYQLIRFGRGLRRVHSLRRDARPLSADQTATARSVISSKRVAFFASSDIAHPVTIGILRPAVILPEDLIPALDQMEFAAIVTHEYAHIRRGDFAVHIACEALSLPFALHPGLRYVTSKISHTRELACDEYAAIQLGQRRTYARALLRLASLCLQTSSGSAVGLGIFNGDNLEDRIMRLTLKNKSFSRASLLGLVLAIGVTFGSGAMFARALSGHTTGSSDAQRFIGTWNWMFQGKSFATMTLTRSEHGLSGTVTESRIALNDDGTLKKADPSDDKTPKQITKAELDGDMLRVTVADGFEFTVSLKDTTHAEIIPAGAPPNMKPIALERVH